MSNSVDVTLIKQYLNAPMPNLNWARRQAIRAQAYYDMCPYPVFGFSEWKPEIRGPLPKCLPFCGNLVKKSAKWLFGKPPRITCTNEKADEIILKAFKKLYPRLLKAAITTLIEGSVTLRFNYNAVDRSCSFSFLSTLDNVRFIYDPHDQTKVLVAYVQYCYYDAELQKWLMYREAWTETTFCTFKPLEVTFAPVKFGENVLYGNVAFILTNTSGGDSYQSAETFTGWEIESSDVNPLGFIPLIQLKNEESDTIYGEGILWRITHMLDRINLSYHLMDRSNQFDSDPATYIIDADLESFDVGSVAPGGTVTVNTRDTVDGGNRQAQVKLIEPSGRLRPYMEGFVSDLREQVCQLVGMVEVSTREISSKGNLTQSVLDLLYEPLIQATDARRSVWETGLEDFFTKCVKSISKPCGIDWKDDKDKFNLQWPAYFSVPEQEKVLKLDRLVKQEGLGLITKERAMRYMASADDVEDIEMFMEELENYSPVYEEMLKKAVPVTDEELPPSKKAEKDSAKSVNQAKPKSKSDEEL